MKAVTHDMNTLYCPHCGCDRVEALGWIQINTGEITDDFIVPKYRCPECDEMIADEDVPVTIKELWKEFGNIAINNNDEIEEDFLMFEAGTYRFDVWHWFDERCPNGLAVDLMGETPKGP